MERAGGTWPATAMVAVVGTSAGDGGWNRCRRWWLEPVPPPTRVVGNPHGISAPTRVVDMSARYIPLAVSTTPSRSRQDASVPTTGAHARVRGALRPRKGRVPDRLPWGAHTRGLIYETRTAHKGLIPPLCAAPRRDGEWARGGAGEPERRTRARTRVRGARAPADRKVPCCSPRRPGWGTLHWSPVGTEPTIA